MQIKRVCCKRFSFCVTLKDQQARCPGNVLHVSLNGQFSGIFSFWCSKMWNNHSLQHTHRLFFSTNDVRIYEPLIIGILQPGDIPEPNWQAELYVKSLALFLRPFVILHIIWLNLNPFLMLFRCSLRHLCTFLWCSLVTPNNSEYFIFTFAIVWHEKIEFIVLLNSLQV